MKINGRATLPLGLTLFACSPGAESVCALPDAVEALPAELREASGAAMASDGTLWLIADSGEPILFAIDDANRISARVRIDNARVDDWEDLAVGPCAGGECLYVGAIGDNLHRRPQREILRVATPAHTDAHVQVEHFPFRFPDGPADAESLAALPDGSLLVITKGRNGPVGVFRYPAPLRDDAVVTLEHVQDLTPGLLQVPQQPTGAVAVGAGTILLRSYTTLQPYTIDADTLAVAGPPVDLTALDESQGEGVAATATGHIVLVGEGPIGGTVARFECVELVEPR